MRGVTRVLQVSGTMHRGGAETFLMNVYRHIDRSRWQFDFACFGEAKGDYDDEIESMGGRVIRVPGAGLMGWTWGLYRFLKAHPEYRIVHAHTGFSSVYFLGAARLAGVSNRLLHSHNTILKNGTIGRLYATISRCLSQFAATRRLSCGRRAALELHGMTSGVGLFPNCVAVDAFRTDPQTRRRVRAEFGVAEDQKLIIQVARLEPVKNHRFTLELCERLRDSAAYKIITMGTGSLEPWFEREIRTRDLGRVLVHAGLRRDIPAVMAAADAMILPSFHEGFPMVAVEAQAAGLPCLMSSTVDPEVDLGLGLVQFIDVNATEAWLQTIRRFLDCTIPDFDERRARLSKLGFDSTVAAERLIQIYQQRSSE